MAERYPELHASRAVPEAAAGAGRHRGPHPGGAAHLQRQRAGLRHPDRRRSRRCCSPGPSDSRPRRTSSSTRSSASGPAAGGLVGPDVDKYNTGRALPRPRRCPPGPDRGPRRRCRGRAGRRARTGPGVRHQPGHGPPGPRPVAPGRARHEPPGRGLVRGRRPGAPAPGSGHHRRSRGRGGRRPSGPRDPRPSASSTRPHRSPTRCRSIAAPTCCGSSGSTSPTTNRSRSSPCGCAATSAPTCRAPMSSGRRSTTCCRCAASSSARCTRRSPPRSRVPRRARPARVRARRAVVVVPARHARRRRTRRRSFSEHRYPADRTTFEIEFSLRAGALQHA